MEFGDVLYSVLTLADECGIDTEHAFQLALDKYQSRINENSDMRSSK